MTKTEYRKMMAEIKSMSKKGIGYAMESDAEILNRYPELWEEAKKIHDDIKEGLITIRDFLEAYWKLMDKAWEKDYLEWIENRRMGG